MAAPEIAPEPASGHGESAHGEPARERARYTGEAAGSSANPLARVLKLLGPGLIAGAADDDPTGLATYAQAGAQTGYGLLWTTLLTLPMMIATQYVATKVAVVKRKGLTQVLRDHYPDPLVYTAVLCLLVANVINAAVDTGAIAAAVTLVVPFPVPRQALVLLIGALLLAFMIWGNDTLIQNVFKWLTLALLAYIVSAFLARPNWGAMLGDTLIPRISFSAAFLTLLVATLGGNISPYLFFWQSDMEVADEQERAHGGRVVRLRGKRLSGKRLSGTLKDVAWDTILGMVFSNVIIYFIEAATAATLFAHGDHNVTSAAQAASALRPLLGSRAVILWAIGMTGAGLLAVPALTGSAADAIASLFAWRHGLERKPQRARRFYAALAAVVGVAVAIDFLPINPIQALVLSAALNGFLSPPLLVLLMLVANRKDIMGAQKNSRLVNIAGWATVVIMSLGAVGLLFTLF